MDNLYARAVFFVEDAERALRFYLEQLGFSQDWTVVEEGRVTVCQVSLFGFEVILNEVWGRTRNHTGHGRVFIGLEDHQGEPVRQHLIANRVQTHRVDWGRPTLVVRDLDGNEIFFWLPNNDFAGLDPTPIDTAKLPGP
jgi:catechol 2,3-dioxygenase-like lactoylglutathione lyase family enzyme